MRGKEDIEGQLEREKRKYIAFSFLKVLSEEQKRKTLESYEDNVNFYGSYVEFDEDEVIKSFEGTIVPFLDQLMKKKNLRGKSVLSIGSGRGRDEVSLLQSEEFLENQMKLDVVDYSFSMLRSALLLGQKINQGFVSDILNLNHLALSNKSSSFSPTPSYAGILIDAALQHLNKSEVYLMLWRLWTWLELGGVLLFRLKVTDHGNVYLINDGVGERYYTSWTRQELQELLAFMEELGFTIELTQTDDHTDNGTPGFFQVLATKGPSPHL